MSRTPSQQRFYDQPEGNVPDSPSSDWRQRGSLSRNDSQRSLTDYQQQLRQPDQLITTRIEESAVEPNLDPVAYQANEYEQQPQNLQPMVEQGGAIYDGGLQQYQEPVYDQSYLQQPELGYAADTQQYVDYSQPQPPQPVLGTTGYDAQQPQPPQPVLGTTGYDAQQPDYTASQYEQPYQPESRRQSPEQRESPPRESPKIADEGLQQRQQSRDQLYGREKTETPEDSSRSSSSQQRQQSRDSLQESQQKSPSPTSPSATKGGTKPSVPSSPTRAKLTAKGGAQQANSRNSVGEAARSGRKSTDMQKQPSKTSIRGKK